MTNLIIAHYCYVVKRNTLLQCSALPISCYNLESSASTNIFNVIIIELSAASYRSTTSAKSFLLSHTSQ